MGQARVEIPVFVSVREGQYVLRPLFRQDPCVSERRLRDALPHFRKAIHREFESWIPDRDNLDDFFWLTFCPELQFAKWKLSFPMGQRDVSESFFAAWFDFQGRRFVILPSSDNSLFIVSPGTGRSVSLEDMQARAVEMIQRRYRAARKDSDDEFDADDFLAREVARGGESVIFEKFALQVRSQSRGKATPDPLAALFGFDQDYFDGRHELYLVAQCLNDEFPEGLSQAFHRDELVDRLSLRLFGRDNTPVALVGPPGCGRTAILHESIRRYCTLEASRNPLHLQRVWHLDPTRVISGMSRVGAWQRRFTSILDYLRDRLYTNFRHYVSDRLYVDNPVALFRVGITSQNKMTLSDVLKPYLEKRSVQLVIEATPGEWDRIQELDRRFADLFDVVRVPPLSESEAVRVLLWCRTELENRYSCEMESAALSRLLDLSRSYDRGLALPGSLVRPLQELAVKHRNGKLSEAEVMEEFKATTGLKPELFDSCRTLEDDDLRRRFREHLTGQDQAIECLMETAHLVKAGICDPEKPFASHLFIGPTGVGKTQAAKALARVLFEKEQHLVRFDMNEYVDADAAARLLGNFDSPEGRLTSIVRHRPFCVILLDEIEKAHPLVHDLLLQVLGEGRLTDALGRTVDFTKTIIVMTSNLGASVAGKEPGFKRTEQDEAATFRREVARFFRPEFVNRIDRVVPFARLTLEDVSRIARTQIEELMKRDGFLRRATVLSLTRQVLEDTASRGFDPVMGGRTLKRLLERELVGLIADRLSSLPPDVPILFELHIRAQKVAPRVIPLEQIPRGPDLVLPTMPRPNALIGGYQEVLDRLQELYAQLEAERERLLAESGAAVEVMYLIGAVRDLTAKAAERVEDLGESRSARRPPVTFRTGAARFRLMATKTNDFAGGVGSVLRVLCRVQEAHDYLQDLYRAAEGVFDAAQEEFLDLRLEVALLEMFAEEVANGRSDKVCIHIRSCVESSRASESSGMVPLPVSRLGAGYRRAIESLRADALAVEVEGQIFLFADGPGLHRLLDPESGVHLVWGGGEVLPMQVRVLSVPPMISPRSFAEAQVRCRAQWIEALRAGLCDFNSDPWPIGRVVRLYENQGLDGVTTDHRTGLIFNGTMTTENWRTLLFGGVVSGE